MKTRNPGWGKWMKEKRIEAKLSGTQLAKLLSVGAGTITHWENEDRIPDQQKIVLWANALHPQDEDFKWTALTKLGYVSEDFSQYIDPSDFFTHRLTQLIKVSRSKNLGFQAIIAREIERFANLWTKCFQIRVDLYNNKDYADALKRAEELLYTRTRDLKKIEPRVLAYLLDIAGNANYHSGKFLYSLEQLDLAIEIGLAVEADLFFANQENLELLATWRIWLAHAYDHYNDSLRVVGDYKTAARMCDAAGVLFRKSNDKLGEIRANRKKALVNLVRGSKSEEAIGICRDSLKRLESISNEKYYPYEKAKTLSTLGWAYNIGENPTRAIETHMQAKAIWEEDTKNGGAETYELIKVYRYLGDDFEQSKPSQIIDSERYYQAALELATQVGLLSKEENDHELGMIFFGLGKIEARKERKGSLELAEHYLNKALRIFQSGDMRYTDKVRAGLIIRNLAKVQMQQKSTERSLEYATEAIDLLASVKAHGYVLGTALEIAECAVQTKDIKLFNKYISFAKELLKDAEQKPPLDDATVKDKYQKRFYRIEAMGSAFV